MLKDLKMETLSYPKGENKKYKTFDLDMNYNQTLFELGTL